MLPAMPCIPARCAPGRRAPTPAPGRRSERVLAVVIALVIVGVSPGAVANVARSSWGADPAGEPVGIRDIAIQHEELAIDLRPLATEARVAVAATYHLQNRGAEQALDLVFVSGASGTRDFLVTLDGQPLTSVPQVGAVLPASWHAPRSTPLPGGGDEAYYLEVAPVLVGFQLVAATGPHELAITYTAEAAHDRRGVPTVLYQFAYVLAPARSWSGFGGLDVTVQLPAGWDIGVTPALVRTGDTLRGVFGEFPADAIALSVQAPRGWYDEARLATLALLAFVVIGGGFGVAARSRARARALAGTGPIPSATVGVAGWSVACCAAGMLAIYGPDHVLPGGPVRHYGYGQAFAVLLVVLGSLIVIPIGLGIVHVAGRRTAPATPRR